jgi:hypothetical protein
MGVGKELAIDPMLGVLTVTKLRDPGYFGMLLRECRLTCALDIQVVLVT